MRFEPFGNKVLVRYTEQMERTAGGLYIPDAAKQKPQTGMVKAVGPDVKTTMVGDKVLFDRYSGTKIEFDGSEFLIIKEEDLMGRVHDKEEAANG